MVHFKHAFFCWATGMYLSNLDSSLKQVGFVNYIDYNILQYLELK